jgi:flagella basal body P-ring formation protein FlgA
MIKYCYVVAMLTLMLNSFSSSVALAEKRIDGYELKEQAKDIITSSGTPLEILVSDRRTFFPCSEALEFSPRNGDDWSTVEVACGSHNWSATLRSTVSSNNVVELNTSSLSDNTAVVIVSQNITQGQVIEQKHLAYAQGQSKDLHGSFRDFTEIVGRKAKFNLARGAILKARHLELSFSVEKGQAVLISSNNSKITVNASAIALEDGQIGDMVKVENSRSGKILNVVVTGEKKVSPITNM